MSVNQIQLSEAGLQELVDNATSESAFLDFKRDLPSRDERSRSEFLKDICAFANGEGGHVIYGIAEKAGKADSLSPIANETADHAARRLGQILEAGVEPRISGIQFVPVPCDNDYVLVVRVPASFDGPHRYSSSGSSKFVIRTGTHTAELSYAQLRSAFDRTASLAERARKTWFDRWNATANGDTWKPIRPGPVCLIQFIPLASMAGRQMISMDAANEHYTQFVFSDWGSASSTFNLDGLVVHHGDLSSDIAAFTQVHRTGIIEAYRTGSIIWNDEKQFHPLQ